MEYGTLRLTLQEISCTFSAMTHKTHIVGYVRKHAKHSVASQQALMAERGITKVYEDFELLLRQRRKGHRDVVAVKRLMLLADPAARRKAGGLRQSLYKAIDALEAAGATILELESNRSTANARERDLAMRDAVDELARTRKGTRRPGRPLRTWTDEQRVIMQLHWRDLRHRTNGAAVAAMNAAGVACTISQVIKLLGASGRPLGPKRKD